jgi:hypothetical protein
MVGALLKRGDALYHQRAYRQVHFFRRAGMTGSKLEAVVLWAFAVLVLMMPWALL